MPLQLARGLFGERQRRLLRVEGDLPLLRVDGGDVVDVDQQTAASSEERVDQTAVCAESGYALLGGGERGQFASHLRADEVEVGVVATGSDIYHVAQLYQSHFVARADAKFHFPLSPAHRSVVGICFFCCTKKGVGTFSSLSTWALDCRE